MYGHDLSSEFSLVSHRARYLCFSRILLGMLDRDSCSGVVGETGSRVDGRTGDASAFIPPPTQTLVDAALMSVGVPISDIVLPTLLMVSPDR